MLLDIAWNILFVAVLFVGVPFTAIALAIWTLGRLRQLRRRDEGGGAAGS